MPFSANTIRRLRHCLIGLACVTTLLAIIWLAEDWRSQRKWTRFIAEQERLGTPVTESPQSEHVPPGENFFETAAIKNLLFGTEPNHARKSLRELSKFNVQRESTESLEDIVKKLPPLPVDSLTENVSSNLTAAQQILAHFSAWETEFTTLRSATRSRPVSLLVYPETLTLQNSYQQLEKISLDDAIGFSRALSIYSQASLSAGQLDDCFENTLVLLRFGSGFCRAPQTLIEILVGCAIINQSLESWKAGITQHAWTAAQLAIVQSHLAGDDKAYADTRSALATCLLAERNRMLAALPQNKDWLLGETIQSWWMPIGESAWWKNNLLQASEKMDRTRAILDDRSISGFREQLLTIKRYEHEIANLSSPYATVAKLSLTNLTDVFAGVAMSTTTRQLALTACALERHYIAHGAYPDSLAALVPTYLPAVPLDIINGDPLRYRRNDNGTFTLYSVGLDGDDDNGRRAPNRTDLDADGDWTW